MKNLLLVFSLMIGLSLNTFAFVSSSANAPTTPAITTIETQFGEMTMEDFLALTPRKIRKKTGQKLSIKEAIALKMAQKKIKKATKKGGGKRQLLAIILGIFLGGLGIHRFYLGDFKIGLIQLLTGGGCGVWAFMDIVRMITGDLKPANGDYSKGIGHVEQKLR